MTAYTNNLKAELGDNLKAVILFGSCVREEHDIGSDMDIFILVTETDKKTVESIRRVSRKYEWDYDTLMPCITRSVSHYNKYYWETIFQSIRKEGWVYYGAA